MQDCLSVFFIEFDCSGLPCLILHFQINFYDEDLNRVNTLYLLSTDTVYYILYTSSLSKMYGDRLTRDMTTAFFQSAPRRESTATHFYQLPPSSSLIHQFLSGTVLALNYYLASEITREHLRAVVWIQLSTVQQKDSIPLSRIFAVIFDWHENKRTTAKPHRNHVSSVSKLGEERERRLSSPTSSARRSKD